MEAVFGVIISKEISSDTETQLLHNRAQCRKIVFTVSIRLRKSPQLRQVLTGLHNSFFPLMETGLILFYFLNIIDQ